MLTLTTHSIENITKEEFIAHYHEIRRMIFTEREFIASLQETYGSIFNKTIVDETKTALDENDVNGENSEIKSKYGKKKHGNKNKNCKKIYEEFGVIAELREISLWNRISHKYTDEEESLMWELIRLLGSLSQCPENPSSMCKNWAVKDELELFKRFYDYCFNLALKDPDKLNNMIGVYSRILAKRRQVRLCDFFV